MQGSLKDIFLHKNISLLSIRVALQSAAVI